MPSSSSALANCVGSRLPRSCSSRVPLVEFWNMLCRSLYRAIGVASDDLPEHQHVAVGVLLLTEQSEWDRPGGVIHGADESQMWSATLQPVVPAPLSAATFPPGGSAPFEGSAWALGDDEGFRFPQPKGPAGRWSRDRWRICQHLGQMGVVEA